MRGRRGGRGRPSRRRGQQALAGAGVGVVVVGVNGLVPLGRAVVDPRVRLLRDPTALGVGADIQHRLVPVVVHDHRSGRVAQQQIGVPLLVGSRLGLEGVDVADVVRAGRGLRRVIASHDVHPGRRSVRIVELVVEAGMRGGGSVTPGRPSAVGAREAAGADGADDADDADDADGDGVSCAAWPPSLTQPYVAKAPTTAATVSATSVRRVEVRCSMGAWRAPGREFVGQFVRVTGRRACGNGVPADGGRTNGSVAWRHWLTHAVLRRRPNGLHAGFTAGPWSCRAQEKPGSRRVGAGRSGGAGHQSGAVGQDDRLDPVAQAEFGQDP